MPIRVLHLIKTFELGGAETNLLNLIRATDVSRAEVHVGYSFGGPFEESFSRLGVPLFRYSEKSCRVASIQSAGIVMRLASYVRKNKIQLVHTHNFNAHMWGLAAAKLSGVKLVEHVHDFRYMPPEEYARRRGYTTQFGFAPRFARLSDCTVVLTKSDEEVLQGLGVPQAKIRRIPNGIPMSASKPVDPSLRTRLGIADGRRIILTPARLSPEKNVDLLARIAPDVVRRVPEACFVIAGTGPEEAALRSEVARLRMEEYFKFIGFFADINQLLGLADIFCLPSFLELHSIALLEALSGGTACVVSSQTGCHDEFLRHTENALLYSPFSDQGWADGISELLRDDAYRHRIGQAGKQLARERFDIQRPAQAFEQLYLEMADGSRNIR